MRYTQKQELEGMPRTEDWRSTLSMSKETDPPEQGYRVLHVHTTERLKYAYNSGSREVRIAECNNG